jgi:hypothetical protein
MAIYKLDILAKEINEELPYWLDPNQKNDKDSPERQAIRDKHRARWLAEQREKVAKDFDESKHPRGEGGKWTEGGGGAGEGVSEGGVDEYGMSAKDRAVVYDWMGSGYRELRSDPSFGKVLEKLPVATGRFWRGTRMTRETFEQYQSGVGRVTKLDKFSSSSMRSSSAKEFMIGSRHESSKKEVAVLFSFKGSGHQIPKPLAETAGSGAEAEVVLGMGDRFKIAAVKSVDDDEYGPYYEIEMEAHGKK